MRTIWKYPIDLHNHTTSFEIPEGAKLLTTAAQGRVVSMWFEVNPTNPRQKRDFTLVPTGGTIPNDGEFIGTAILRPGRGFVPVGLLDDVVVHVYEVSAL